MFYPSALADDMTPAAPWCICSTAHQLVQSVSLLSEVKDIVFVREDNNNRRVYQSPCFPEIQILIAAPLGLSFCELWRDLTFFRICVYDDK